MTDISIPKLREGIETFHAQRTFPRGSHASLSERQAAPRQRPATKITELCIIATSDTKEA